MVDLSKRQGTRPVPLSEIAESQHISLSYLEQMFAGLRRRGLVKSHRGPGGGYLLALPADKISVATIIRAAEDGPTPRRPRNTQRQNEGSEATERLWKGVNTLIFNLLERVSLDDVTAERVEIYKNIFRTEV